jgi:hypothetical protein
MGIAQSSLSEFDQEMANTGADSFHRDHKNLLLTAANFS